MDYDNQLPQTKIQIVTRLRGPLLKNQQSKKDTSKKKKDVSNSPLQKKETLNSKNKSEKSPNKSPSTRTLASNKLNENTKYTMFTSNEPGNTMIVSSEPILGKSINETFQSSNDLYEFSHSILKETSLFEFDKIYNETHKLNLIYDECLKESITNLFHGRNSCVFLFGPIDGGKSHLLRGGSDQKLNEIGLISKAMDEILNLIEINRQAAGYQGKNKFDYVIKCSAIQVYLDTASDLLSKEPNQIQIEKYIDDNGNVNCNLLNLTEREIRNKIEYDLCIKDAVNQRKWLTQLFKVNDLKRKSHFIISIKIQKKEKFSKEQSMTFVRNSSNITPNLGNNPGDIITMETSIDNFAQIDFVELSSSNFGFMNEEEIADESLNGIIHRNTSKVFNTISSNIVAIASGTKPKIESKLTLALKKTLQPGSFITFFNCVIPWEYPLDQSYKALKFANWLRNQVLNLNENIELRIGTSGSEGNNLISYGNVNCKSNPNSYQLNNFEDISPRININNQTSKSQIVNPNDYPDNDFEEEYSREERVNQGGIMNKSNPINISNQNIREANNKSYNKDVHKARSAKSLGIKHRQLSSYDKLPSQKSFKSNSRNIPTEPLNKNDTNNSRASKSRSPNCLRQKDKIPSISNMAENERSLLRNKGMKREGNINNEIEPNMINENSNKNHGSRVKPIFNNTIKSAPVSYKKLNPNMTYQADFNGDITRISNKDPVNRSMRQDMTQIKNLNNGNLGRMTSYNKEIENNSNFPIEYASTKATGMYDRNKQIPTNPNQSNNDMNDMNNGNEYDSAEEQEVRMLRQRAANKYNTQSPLNHVPTRKEIQRTQSEAAQEQKLKVLEDSLRVLQERSFEMNQQLENMRQERGFPGDGCRYEVHPTSVSYMPDAEIDKIKQDHVTLKSDNIIFREDINRLTELNKHLDDELAVQRARNLELAGENERIAQEKVLVENENLKLKEDLAKSKVDEKSLVDNFNQKLQMENRLKEAESELAAMREAKARFEVEFRVLKEKYDNLTRNNEELSSAYNKMKCSHDDEVGKIEEKVDLMSKEIENLQKENYGLRANDEKQRQEINTLEKIRDQYKDKYQEQKNKNVLLNQKLNEIEEDFRCLMRDKENENNLKTKEEEMKKMKVESKNKIVNEFQNKIANFRNERLKKKNEESINASANFGTFGDL